jgi:hypothetical protein
MITVLPEGGLCNRMRVVASASLLAQASGQSLRVLWYQTPDFNAPFFLLFNIEKLPFEVCEGRAMRRVERFRFRLLEQWKRLCGVSVLGNRETEPGRFDFVAMAERIRGREVFIRSNSRLHCVAGMYDCFVPTGEAREILDTLHAKLKNCVGVHVRRTDNANAIKFSSLECFVSEMRNEVERDRDVRFFLASDSPEVSCRLKQEFGDSVWTYDKRAYSRDDPKAIVDALVDLYALAACQKLIGSYWSSFTDTAAEIHDIPLCIAGEKPST